MTINEIYLIEHNRYTDLIPFTSPSLTEFTISMVSNNMPTLKSEFGSHNKLLCSEKTLHTGSTIMVGAVVCIDWQLQQST